MGLVSLVTWIIGQIFFFVFERIDDCVMWILPSYFTVQVIKQSQETSFKNYLCFWTVLAIILGLEHVTLYLFYGFNVYRLARFVFVLWLQLDSCSNAVMLFSYLQPLMKPELEKKMESVFNLVSSKIDEHGAAVQGKVSDQFWGFVSSNYELIKDGLFKALSTASEKAVNLADRNSTTNLNATIPTKEGEKKDIVAEPKEAVQKKES